MSVASALDYRYLRHLVSVHTQNVLDPSCDYLFDARLSMVLRNQGMSRPDELVQYLRTHSDPVLERAIAEAMTINETSFFRDARLFELLRTDLLPKLIESRRKTRTLRLWSAACSTGQEALSLAILLREHFPQLVNWDIRIEGTDISAQVVARAREGRYHRIEMNRGLPARLLVKYFNNDAEEWAAKPEIRDLCHFGRANLCAMPLPYRECFDVILLRNVMLYFAPETRRSLLARVHRLVARDGLLFLGSSEQASESTLWRPVLTAGTCYYQPRETPARG